MKIKIKGTSAVKDLTIIDSTSGCEWTKDLIEAGNMESDEDGITIMAQDDYDWWTEYIDNHNADEAEAEKLAEEYCLDVNELITEALNGVTDLEDEHPVKLSVFAQIRGNNTVIPADSAWEVARKLHPDEPDLFRTDIPTGCPGNYIPGGRLPNTGSIASGCIGMVCSDCWKAQC